jgi:hypothetical protein
MERGLRVEVFRPPRSVDTTDSLLSFLLERSFMVSLTAPAHDHFARQHGVASVPQLVQAGVDRRQIERLAETGAIELVLRGVYRSRSVQLDELGRCAAICLTRPDIAIAGPTAGRLWRFRRLPRDERVHVLAPPASNPAIAAWVRTYRTAAVHADDIIERSDGIRITTRARTAFDLARSLRSDDLLSVIEQAMHDGGIDEWALRSVAVDWLSPRRPWVRAFLRQLDRRLTGGAAESHPEVRVGAALAQSGVRGLVRQYELDIPDYGPARFDLAVPSMRWAIEIDVFPTHDETIGRLRDHRRDAAAVNSGWVTTRLSRLEYEGDLDGWIERTASLYRTLLRQSAS